MLLRKEGDVSREAEMTKLRWQHAGDTSDALATVKVTTTITPAVQLMQTERKKEATDDLVQTIECEGGVVGETGGDEVDVVITEHLGVRISVLQKEAQHCALRLMIEKSTCLVWSDIHSDILLVIQCNDDFPILYLRLLPLVLSMQLLLQHTMMMVEADW